MSGRRRRLAWALLAVFAGPARAFADPLRIDGFAPPVLDGVTIVQGTGGPQTTVRFAGGRPWPALRFSATAPRDWSTAGALALPVDNPGDTPFDLLLRLDDDPQADGGDRSLTGIVTLPPHAHGEVILPLAAGPPGMRGRPSAFGTTQPGDLVAAMRGSVDTHHIVGLHISGIHPNTDQELAVSAPHLRERTADAPQTGPLVDTFGQAIAGRWPEKVDNDADLRRKLADAAAATTRLLYENPPPADRFGGLPGTPSRATGFFRVEKAGGRWRLVSPAGHAFFSLGVDAVAAANPTIVAGRRNLFAGLPAPQMPLAAFLKADATHGTMLDVGQANLMRAMGVGWRARWDAEVVRRLRAWGFNTLGNWSDPGLAASNLATVTFYDVEGASAMVPMDGGRSLPDPFDPAYPAVADGVAQAMTDANRAAPALLGYFSGNEMPWGSADRRAAGIAAHVLALGEASPAKRALVALLRARFASTATWAATWGVADPGSWERLLARPFVLPPVLSAAARDDIVAFQGLFAERYFSTVAEAIRRHDPHHLYLGTRFAAGPPEVVAACARWCDVLSFNVYGATPEAEAERWRAFDRPVLIGEFHFGSTDRGSFWPGMVDVGAEDKRGPAYAAYLDAAARDPAIVGVHWYQYADEPLTGRPYDGENGHIGLVAVTDVPYGGFVSAVAAANRRVLQRLAAPADTGRAATVP